MTYTNIDDSDLRGDTLADYLIAIDADFEIRDGDRVIYEEPAFPVVELARALTSWMASGKAGDFAFDTMSSDESGLVTISRGTTGWRLFSVFTPEVVSAEIDEKALESCLQEFIDQVSTDLKRQGHDVDRIIRS